MDGDLTKRLTDEEIIKEVQAALSTATNPQPNIENILAALKGKNNNRPTGGMRPNGSTPVA